VIKSREKGRVLDILRLALMLPAALTLGLVRGNGGCGGTVATLQCRLLPRVNHQEKLGWCCFAGWGGMGRDWP
jgi:hypothetical protein